MSCRIAPRRLSALLLVGLVLGPPTVAWGQGFDDPSPSDTSQQFGATSATNAAGGSG